jgi:hypothetical protein
MKVKFKPICGKRDGHPSGRPETKSDKRSAAYGVNYHDEPLTPGLRRRQLQNAIGFTANLQTDYDED